MGLNRNCDCSNFCHGIFRGVLRVLDKNPLALMRFGPILLEQAFVYPFDTGSRERFGKHTARKCASVQQEWRELIQFLALTSRPLIDILLLIGRQAAQLQRLGAAFQLESTWGAVEAVEAGVLLVVEERQVSLNALEA